MLQQRGWQRPWQGLLDEYEAGTQPAFPRRSMISGPTSPASCTLRGTESLGGSSNQGHPGVNGTLGTGR
jgi:hypothetical protein